MNNLEIAAKLETLTPAQLAKHLTLTTGYTSSVRKGTVMVYDETTSWIDLPTFIIFTMGA